MHGLERRSASNLEQECSLAKVLLKLSTLLPRSRRQRNPQAATRRGQLQGQLDHLLIDLLAHTLASCIARAELTPRDVDISRSEQLLHENNLNQSENLSCQSETVSTETSIDR
jgi:hypothetical protein